MDTQPIQDMGDAVLVSISDALRNLAGFLPQLLGAILLLIIGWIVAGLLAGLVERLLRAVGFERAAERSGIAGFIAHSGAGAEWTASRLVAEIVKWFIRLVFLQAAAAVLGMPQLSEIINAILLFLPNLVVALAIVVVGALLARFVAGVVRGATAEMGFANPGLLATLARVAIVGFALIAAVNQLGIAATVVNTLFIGLVAAVAGALALAFGLGGRDTAAQITAAWYARGQQASARVAEYAERKQQAQQAPQAGGAPAGIPPSLNQRGGESPPRG